MQNTISGQKITSDPKHVGTVYVTKQPGGKVTTTPVGGAIIGACLGPTPSQGSGQLHLPTWGLHGDSKGASPSKPTHSKSLQDRLKDLGVRVPNGSPRIW